MKPKRKQACFAILSMAGFVILWAIVTDAWNYSGHLFPGPPRRIYPYLYGYFSRVLWMLPAFFLMRKFDRSLFWSRKQLFAKPKAEPVFLVFLVLTTIYALACAGGNDQYRQIPGEVLLLLTIKLLLVGIGEEAVFRGWGYNLLKRTHSDAGALAISASMFVAVHWPAYLIKLLLHGQFDWLGAASQSISALFCGVLFGVMLKRSGSLWNPIIAHFYYDWMLEVFT